MVLLGVAIAALIVIFFIQDRPENTRYMIGTAGIIAGVFATVSIIWGSLIYPTLVGRHASAIALQAEIATVKEAHYKEVGEGLLVGGSLDNIKQSTVLSDYIKMYAREKASYNRGLAEAKAFRETPFHRYFLHGLFISKKIYKLDPLR